MNNSTKSKKLYEKATTKYNTLFSKQKDMTQQELIQELEEIVENYNKSIKLYKPENKKAYKNIGVARANLAELYFDNGKINEALTLFDSAIGSFCHIEVNDTQNYIQERFYSAYIYKKMAKIYRTIGDNKEWIISLQCAYEEYLSILEIEPNSIDALNNIAFGEFELGKFFSDQANKPKALDKFLNALNYYQIALSYNNSTDSMFDVSATYSRLGKIYDELGDYPKSIEAFEQAIKYGQDILSVEDDLETLANIAVYQSDMANIYKIIGKEREAIELYQKAIKNSLLVIEKTPKDIITLNNIAISYSDLARIYRYRGTISRDETMIKEAIKLFLLSIDYYNLANSIEPKDTITLVNKAINYSNIAKLLVYTKQPHKAIEILNKSLNTLSIASKIEKTKDVINHTVQVKSTMAQIYNSIDNHQKALSLLHEAIDEMIEDNSNLNQTNDNTSIQSELALTYKYMNQREKSTTEFKKVLNSYQKILSINPNNIMVFENIARVYDFLVVLNADDKYIDEAIRWNYKVIERYGDMFWEILFEEDALNITKNMLFPLNRLIDVYIHTDKSADILLLNAIEMVKAKKLKQLISAKIIDSNSFPNPNNSIDTANRQKLYDEFQKKVYELSKQFPILQEESKIEDLSKILDNQSVILYPMYDGENLTIISVTNRDIDIYREVIQKDIVFINYIAKGVKSLQKALTYIDKQIINSIPKGVKKIYFSPFGELNLLPLHAISIGNRKYLIEEYEISYIPSLSILDMLKKRSTPISDFRDNIFISIDEFKKESEIIKKIIGGEDFVDMNSIEFKKAIHQQNFNTIHLSTHGSIDISNPLNTYLLIREPNTKISLLDIYSLNFRANLVTISACQTNISKILGSDEILAFERAFLVAGADNTITTFDSVHAVRSMEFMEIFYQNIKDGKSISNSFREACYDGIDFENDEWMLFRLTGN